MHGQNFAAVSRLLSTLGGIIFVATHDAGHVPLEGLRDRHGTNLAARRDCQLPVRARNIVSDLLAGTFMCESTAAETRRARRDKPPHGPRGTTFPEASATAKLFVNSREIALNGRGRTLERPTAAEQRPRVCSSCRNEPSKGRLLPTTRRSWLPGRALRHGRAVGEPIITTQYDLPGTPEPAQRPRSSCSGGSWLGRGDAMGNMEVAGARGVAVGVDRGAAGAPTGAGDVPSNRGT